MKEHWTNRTLWVLSSHEQGCLARGAGLCLKLPFLLCHCVVCLGKAYSKPLPSFLQPHTGSGGTHRAMQAPGAHPHRVNTDIPESSFLPKMAWNGTSAAASSSCSASRFHPGEAQKRDLPFGFSHQRRSKVFLYRQEKAFLPGVGAEHTTAPPQWCVRMTSLCQ